jgi:hypothetical protein
MDEEKDSVIVNMMTRYLTEESYYEFDPVLGDQYGYPKIEFMGKGWVRFSVGWALIGEDEDEPAMYFDYFFKEDEWFLHLNGTYIEAYVFNNEKIGFGFTFYPYYQEYLGEYDE